MKRNSLILLGLTVAVLVGAQVATAGPSGSTVQLSGTYAVTDFGTLTCATNGSPFVLRCKVAGFVSDYSGGLTGTTISEFAVRIDCITGRSHAHGTETFTGTVAGVGTGTLTWRIHATSAFDCATFTESGLSATGVVVSGTGALGHLNGSIEFGPTTYDGELH